MASFLVWPRTLRDPQITQGSYILFSLSSFSPNFPCAFSGCVRPCTSACTPTMLFVDHFRSDGCCARREKDTQMGNGRLLAPGGPKKETS